MAVVDAGLAEGAHGLGLGPGLPLARVDLRLMGGLALVTADGGTWRPVRLECRRLLAHLALERGKRLERTSLAYRLWPDQPEVVAVDRLRRMLHELRAELRAKGLGEALRFHADRQRLGLEEGGPLRVDAATFQHACDDLQLLSDAGAEVLGMLEGPLALGAQPLLPELTASDDWLAQQAERLTDGYLTAMALLRDRLEAAGDLPAALRCAERMTTAAPLCTITPPISVPTPDSASATSASDPPPRIKLRLWDTFITPAVTSKKLDVSFHRYVFDLVSGTNDISPLADIIRKRTADLDLGASWRPDSRAAVPGFLERISS